MNNIQVEMRRATIMVLAAALILSACQSSTVTLTGGIAQQVEVAAAATQLAGPASSLTPKQPSTLVPTPTSKQPSTPGPSPTLKQLPTPAATSTRRGLHPNAPLCPDTGQAHVHSRFHTLWDAQRRCHYDHEHGQNPFTPDVAATFPGFALRALLGDVGVGHTDPSSPAENVAKHGGFKWQVDLHAPHGCAVGSEDGTVAVDAYAIQYHNFGPQSIELEARRHSASALLRQCKPDNPGDKGYIYVVQLEEFGQRVSPYQGTVLPYPDNPSPAYRSGFGPYLTSDCVGAGLPGCRASISDIIRMNSNANSIWTSKSTGSGTGPETSQLFRLLFRIRDTYQVLDSADLEHPFTWLFVCGGASYNPAGCRWNNTTSTIHEIAGDIPASWDGLAGFDGDPRPGRITARGYVTRYGTLNSLCTTPNPETDCYPIKMVGAFVGRYSSELSAGKVSNPTPGDTPERDIYFCNAVPCSETAPGAVPSGWIGPNN